MNSAPHPHTSLRQCTIRLVRTGSQGSSYGSGVLVAPNTILTARHVVTDGAMSSPEHIRVESIGALGRPTVDRFSFPARTDIDLALAFLDPPKTLMPHAQCVLRSEPRNAVNIGDEVQVAGITSAHGDIQVSTLNVLAIHDHAEAYICDRSVPEGYSGGPVFAKGALIGIMYARHFGNGQSYFYSGAQIAELLAQANVPVTWSNDTGSQLLRYPLTPGIAPFETAMRLVGLSNNCIALYGPAKAREIVATGNQARFKCGPDTGAKGLIETHSLPTPEHNLEAFWHGAFMQAGQKSPRMLAALLLALDDENLERASVKEKKAMLEYLANVES
jgi:hypothetical protein